MAITAFYRLAAPSIPGGAENALIALPFTCCFSTGQRTRGIGETGAVHRGGVDLTAAADPHGGTDTETATETGTTIVETEVNCQ